MQCTFNICVRVFRDLVCRTAGLYIHNQCEAFQNFGRHFRKLRRFLPICGGVVITSATKSVRTGKNGFRVDDFVLRQQKQPIAQRIIGSSSFNIGS